VPRFQSHATRAKEAVAKDSLRILRSAIELYTTQHGGIPPGYQDDDPDTVPSSSIFSNQLVLEGRYVLKMPENPFNGLKTTLVIANNGTFPNAATGTYGWVYQPATITIRLDWPGTDKTGLRYYDY
jgi:type II secretory pathway pseudopilin PulG